jgi:Fe-S oxidoreductase
MVCRNLEDLYELSLLGTLEGEEAREIAEHVARGCPNCIYQLREATLTLYLLAGTAKPARLKPKQKSHLLRRLKKK